METNTEVVDQRAGRALRKLSPRARLAVLVLMVLSLATAVDHVVASVVGFAPPGATYRRIGPVDGPQVYCAGSSMLQYGILWSDVSRTLGQGVEHWGVPGSSPEIWEQSQLQRPTSNLAIVGISIIDMNEERRVDARASTVPLSQTIADLRESGTSLAESKRILSQYPLEYLQTAFPTAGDPDAVLVGMRRILREMLGLSSVAEDRDRALVLPSGSALDFGKDSAKVSSWPKDRVLRRLDTARAADRGIYSFSGVKELVFRRMLTRAGRQGRAIVVVLPVSSPYLNDLPPNAVKDFNASVEETSRQFPDVEFIRFDLEPSLKSDDYFSDFFHMNEFGRAIATKLFLERLTS